MKERGDEGVGLPKLIVCMKKPYIILILGMLIKQKKKLIAEWSFPV